jgi:dihydropyrimidine dehydrogenase (NAD+) subunit PreA
MYELNLSCPHYVEKGNCLSIGQDPILASKVVEMAKKVTDIPIMPKLSANVTDIIIIGNALKGSGANALSAINTIKALLGINIEKIEIEPSVNGLSTFGGLSGPAIKPIALRCIVELYKSVKLPISGSGGIYSWEDAVQFLMCGSSTLQLTTLVMFEGFNTISKLKQGLKNYLIKKEFKNINDIIGILVDRIVQPNELNMNNRVLYKIDNDKCIGCKKCYIACRDAGFEAISIINNKAVIDPSKCDGCSLCCQVCPIENCISTLSGLENF